MSRVLYLLYIQISGVDIKIGMAFFEIPLYLQEKTNSLLYEIVDLEFESY